MAFAAFAGWQGDDLDKGARFVLAAFLDGFVFGDTVSEGEATGDRGKVLFAPVYVELDRRLHPDVVRWLFDRVLEQYEVARAREEAREEAEFFAELELD